MLYKHTQLGLTMMIIFVMIILFLIVINRHGSMIMAVFMSCLAVLFSTLTISVQEENIEWYFGPYFLKKQLALKDISQVKTTENKWYNGFGIRNLKRGTLYNVSGLNAVYIQTKSGKVIMLGTDEPEMLLDAIQCARKQQGHHCPETLTMPKT